MVPEGLAPRPRSAWDGFGWVAYVTTAGGPDKVFFVGQGDRPRLQFAQEVKMAIRTTRSAGMLLLGIWLILTGVAGFAALPIPGVLMAALALIAGVLILIGM